ncbi:MAG: DUF1501 domain-containing protein [Bdellovibrionaceae bacterium]|nr:DUF1501 domain-containing protein [Bdellovibrio sp.]
MKQTRRNFLKNSALAFAGHAPIIGGLSAMTTQAFAAALNDANDFNFVLFRVVGGMDSTLGIHPYLNSKTNLAESELFLDYNPATDVMPNIMGTQISLGPSAYALAPFARQMAVVRGIYMGASDIGHPAAIQHISSGRGSQSAPHMAAYIAAKLSDSSRFVVSNAAIQRGTVEAFPVILTQSLKKLGQPERFATASSLNLYQQPDLAVSRYLNLLKQKNKLIKFNEVLNAQPKSEEIQDESVALACLAAGLTRTVQIDMIDQTHDLDSHSGHSMHKSYQKMRWDRIAAFLQGLVNNQLLEKTLVMVVTEFNRSPGKNFNDGKDHNYTDNAVALFGRNVAGGKVIGDRKLYLSTPESPSVWAGSYINYKSGKVSELDALIKMQTTGSTVLPEHTNLIRPIDVWSTVTHSLSPELSKTFAAESLRIPGVFKA